MNIKKNVSLKRYNSFAIDIKADYFIEIKTNQEFQPLIEWINHHDVPFVFLGGGSNILFTQDYHGLAIYINTKGKQCISESDTHYLIEVNAGENWHDFVRWSIDQGYTGLENLSLIPGTVGAAPMQNIGAYGVELADRFYSLQALHIETGKLLTFNKTACNFAYRHSFFKQNLGKYLIQSVTFQLPKKPNWCITYAGIKQQLKGQTLSARLISDTIIQLRQSKLPDPNKIANAGSFFKNPLLTPHAIQQLQQQYPSMPSYPQSNGQVKTSAAWLIDQCGWKGKAYGQAAVYEKHALVLINKGRATGAEIAQLSIKIQQSVYTKFAIQLEAEPRIM
jgi:UDP-N-acetylmuramate dehydrogenase